MSGKDAATTEPSSAATDGPATPAVAGAASSPSGPITLPGSSGDVVSRPPVVLRYVPAATGLASPSGSAATRRSTGWRIADVVGSRRSRSAGDPGAAKPSSIWRPATWSAVHSPRSTSWRTVGAVVAPAGGLRATETETETCGMTASEAPRSPAGAVARSGSPPRTVAQAVEPPCWNSTAGMVVVGGRLTTRAVRSSAGRAASNRAVMASARVPTSSAAVPTGMWAGLTTSHRAAMAAVSGANTGVAGPADEPVDGRGIDTIRPVIPAWPSRSRRRSARSRRVPAPARSAARCPHRTSVTGSAPLEVGGSTAMCSCTKRTIATGSLPATAAAASVPRWSGLCRMIACRRRRMS